tara:strand:+ start:38616 stop:39047 length:432 start_codon:yes stop_codon:yes gene_type:complete
MALKRRVEKNYSLDEMMYIINKHFIEQEKNRPSDIEPIRKFSIEPTCFKGDVQRWIVCDSRSTSSEVDHIADLLPTYYGSTILESVTKCFMDRANHDKKIGGGAYIAGANKPLPIKKLKLKQLDTGVIIGDSPTKPLTKRSLF